MNEIRLSGATSRAGVHLSQHEIIDLIRDAAFEAIRQVESRYSVNKPPKSVGSERYIAVVERVTERLIEFGFWRDHETENETGQARLLFRPHLEAASIEEILGKPERPILMHLLFCRGERIITDDGVRFLVNKKGTLSRLLVRENFRFVPQLPLFDEKPKEDPEPELHQYCWFHWFCDGHGDQMYLDVNIILPISLSPCGTKFEFLECIPIFAGHPFRGSVSRTAQMEGPVVLPEIQEMSDGESPDEVDHV